MILNETDLAWVCGLVYPLCHVRPDGKDVVGEKVKNEIRIEFKRSFSRFGQN